MGEYGHRFVSVLALLTGGLVVWFLGDALLGLTAAVLDRLGPVWSLASVGIVTLLLATVWIRYGGAGALARWGVTIKPARPPEPDSADPAHGRDHADADLPETGGRRGPS